MNENNVKLFVCGDVKPPQRKAGDAGIDFFCPNFTEKFIKDLASKNPGLPFKWGLISAPKKPDNEKDDGYYIQVPPHEDILIPTYVKARFPDNVVLQVDNKSGVATGQKFVFGANTIDSSYQGILHIHIINFSTSVRFIEFGQKLVQMVPKIINKEEIEIYYDNTIEAFKEYRNFISVEQFYEGMESDRKENGFGSTGIK